MNLQKNRQLINFMLLHSYSLTNSGLMFGKSGIALCLFEAARFFEYEKLEEYGLELLQEAIKVGNKRLFISKRESWYHLCR